MECVVTSSESATYQATLELRKEEYKTCVGAGERVEGRFASISYVAPLLMYLHFRGLLVYNILTSLKFIYIQGLGSFNGKHVLTRAEPSQWFIHSHTTPILTSI